MIDVEVRSFGDQLSNEKNLNVTGYDGWEKIGRCEEKHSTALQTLATNLLMMCDGINSDVVHTHTWYAHFAGFLAKKLYGTPFVATCHTIDKLRPWKEDALGSGYHISNWIEEVSLQLADRIIAVSNAMREDIVKYLKVPEEKVIVIHNGIDTDKWNYRPIYDGLKKKYNLKDDYVLFVGRPSPQKGMEYLIEAADDIEAQVVMASFGADTPAYENDIKHRVQTKNNLLWINEQLKEDERIQLYSSARVYVCPSIYEPFGIVNLEAMACKTPVVATVVGGIKEIVIPEKTGILIDPGNSQQIADNVNRLLRERQFADKLGENGRKRVEDHFSWATVARNTKRIYESIFSKY
jgi:glycogen synthase